MKTFALSAALAGGFLLALTPTAAPAADAAAAAPTEAAAEKSPADIAHDAVWAIHREPPANPNLMKESPRDYYRWLGEKYQRFHDAALAFAEKFPHDPRRWEAIVQSSYTRPLYLTGFKDDFDAKPGWGGLLEDEVKIEAFRAAQAQRFAALQASTDATPRQRTGAFGALITEALGRFGKNKTPENKAAYVRLVDEFLEKVPAGATVLARSHLAFLDANGTAEEKAAFVKKLEASGDPGVQRLVAESRGDFKRFDGIASLTFTAAADGSEVDLTKLRGKVVLVDFWATWCGPCVAEIPNVVANYQKYHAKGFEVIGVTLESSGVSDKDDAATRERKLEAAKKKMLAFTAKHEMPWPQYFDGLHWKNELARRFGIESIPAMVLIDPAGKVVAIEARGPKLEEELKRLLKL